MEPDDETAVTEITIQPDGRVFVLGASRQVLEVLEALNPEDVGLKKRLEHAGGKGTCASLEVGDEMKISGRSTNSSQEESQP